MPDAHRQDQAGACPRTPRSPGRRRHYGPDPAQPVAGCDRDRGCLLGAANQAEDNRNVARMAVLLAGLPVEIPGATVNRLCGSGMEAVCDVARTIAAGDADVCLAGSESMTRAPFVLGRSADAFPRAMDLADTRLGWRLVSPRMKEMYPPITLGETAENVAAKYGLPGAPGRTGAAQPPAGRRRARRPAGSTPRWCRSPPRAARSGTMAADPRRHRPRGPGRQGAAFRKDGTVTGADSSPR